MATFEELMRAASNADRAGDEDAARKLVDAARRVRGETAQRQFDSVTGQEMAMRPPGADFPTAANPRPDRFGDTIEAATRQPRQAFTAFREGLRDQSVSPTMQALPEGMPGRKPLAFAGDTLMTGVAGVGVGIGGAAGLAGELVGGSPTNEMRLARDLTMGATVAVPELAGVSGTVRATGSAIRAAEELSAGPRTPVQAGARAADDLGITPSLGMTGKGPAMGAATLEKVPGSGGVIARDMERAVGEIEGAFNRIVGGVAEPQSALGAGDVLQTGLREFRDNFKARSSDMYDAVAQHLPPDTRFSLDNTAAAMQGARAHFQQNPELAARLGLGDWDAVLSEAAENGISWQAAREFRTSVGEAVGQVKGPLAGDSDRRLKALYGALSQDMDAAARAAGPEAVQAWNRATSHHRAGARRIQRVLDRTIDADNPERAFEAFRNMAMEGRASSDVRRMRQIKSSLSRDDWNVVSASIVDRLGRARPGQQNAAGDAFSPVTFLTEWNKLNREAKVILLPANVRDELNKLASVAEQARAAGAERNVSNTGTVLTGAATGAAAVQAPLATMGVLAGTAVSSRAFTSPIMLRALNTHARGDSRALRRLANGNGPFARDAETILRLSAAQSATGPEAANATAQPMRMAQ